MFPTMGFARVRFVPPAEGTFDIFARGRVEPEGFAPTIIPSGVFTIDAVGRVEPIGEIPDPPAKPTGNTAPDMGGDVVVAGGITDGDFEVLDEGAQEWTNNDPGNTDTIRVQEAEDVGFTTGLTEVTLAGSATSHAWTNQKDGVTRYYRVRAENGSGESAWSDVVSAKHYTADPGAVIPVLSSPSESQLTVTWPDASGTVGEYRVQIDDGAGSYNAHVTKSASANAHTFSGLNQADAYSVRLVAVGPDSQCGEVSDAVAATSHQEPGLTGCYVERLDGAGKLVKFYKLDITDNSPDATSFKVYRNGSLYDTISTGDQFYEPAEQSGSWHVVASGGTTSHPDDAKVSIPDSQDSNTRTMPGDFDDTQCGPA